MDGNGGKEDERVMSGSIIPTKSLDSTEVNIVVRSSGGMIPVPSESGANQEKGELDEMRISAIPAVPSSDDSIRNSLTSIGDEGTPGNDMSIAELGKDNQPENNTVGVEQGDILPSPEEKETSAEHKEKEKDVKNGVTKNGDESNIRKEKESNIINNGDKDMTKSKPNDNEDNNIDDEKSIVESTEIEDQEGNSLCIYICMFFVFAAIVLLLLFLHFVNKENNEVEKFLKDINSAC